MSLRDAQAPLMHLPELPPGAPPYPCAALSRWAGLDIDLPPGDPRLRALDRGGAEPSDPLANLVGARRAWDDHPEYMDFLDVDSPVHRKKRLERELYLHWWGAELRPGSRVLDLGGGIGRFTTWCLDLGCEVELVDPDLRSLRCALRHSAGRRGRLDLHWTTAEHLPELAPVDVVIAAELLNYVEDPARVLANARRLLRPGGPLLFSVEARWGWALAVDAVAGTLPGWLDEAGVVFRPGDLWVRTYSEAAVRALFAGWTVERLIPTHYVMSGPFEQAAGPLDLPGILDAESRLREHPISAPLHRAWTGIAR